MSDKKYPYIADNGNGTVVLFTMVDYGLLLKKSQHSNREFGSWCSWSEKVFKNITREYLTNTYGKVESKEHAEFIVELAESAGFEIDLNAESMNSIASFMIYKSHIGLYHLPQNELSNEEGRKQITIPMPPKCDEPLNNGDNLMFGGEDKCKEWPAVGDEVVAPFNHINVKATVCWQRVNNGGMHVSLVFKGDYESFWCATESLQKPKTSEEELRDELIEIWNDEPDRDSIIDAVMSKYNITKKPQ